MQQASINQTFVTFSLTVFELSYRNINDENSKPTEKIEDSLYVEEDMTGCAAAEVIKAAGSRNISQRPCPA